MNDETIRHIEKLVCNSFSIYTDMGLSNALGSYRSFFRLRRWTRPISRPRQALWWILYNVSACRPERLSTLALAEIYGFDHTTIQHGITRLSYDIIDRPTSYEVGFLKHIAQAVDPELDLMDSFSVRLKMSRMAGDME